MDVKWIKVSTGLFGNRKIKQLEAMPDGDSLIVIWLKLLILASEVNDSGAVYITREIPYTDQLLANQFNRPISTVQLALKMFQQFGMIEIVDNVLQISNWQKYQSVEGMEKIREQNRLRAQKYREKQRLLTDSDSGNVTGNVTSNVKSNVTCNDHKNRIDQNRKDKNNTNRSAVHTEFDELWSMYPRKQGRKEALAAYERARKSGTSFEEVKEGIERYVAWIKATNKDPQYIQQGKTFFRGNGWADDWKVNNPPIPEDDHLLDGII